MREREENMGLSFSVIFTTLKPITSTIGGIASAIRTFASIGKWVGSRRSVQLRNIANALNEPHRRVIHNLPKQILRYLADEDRAFEFSQLSESTNPDISAHIQALARDLQLPEFLEPQRQVIARELVEEILLHLRRSTLTSASGPTLTEHLSSQRHGETMTGIRELSELVKARLPDRLNSQFERFEAAANGRPPAEALAIWETAERELTSGETNVKTLSDLHRRLGAAYWNVGQLNKAQEHYNRSHALDPTTAGARIGRSLALGLEHRYQEAEKLVRAVIASDQATTDGLIALGQILLWSDNHSEIDTEIAPKIDAPGVDAAMRENLIRIYATSLLARGHHSDAAQQIRKLGTTSEMHASDKIILAFALLGITQSQVRKGQDLVAQVPLASEAAQLLEAALTDSSIRSDQKTSLRTMAGLATAKHLTGDDNSALRLVSEILQQSPSDVETLGSTSYVAAFTGRQDLAKKALELIPIESLSEFYTSALLDLIASEAQSDVHEAALDFIRRRYPGRPIEEIPLEPLMSYLKIIGNKLGQYTEAEQLAAKRLAIEPKNLALLVICAQFALKTGERERAWELAQSAINVAENGFSEPLYELAKILIALDHPVEAIHCLDKLGVDDSSPPFVLHALAQALFNSERPDDEERLLALTANHPDDVTLAHARTLTHERRGNLAAAELEWRRLLKIKTTDSLLLGFCICLFRTGKREECQANLDRVRIPELDTLDQFRLAQLHLYLDQPKEAIRAAFAAWCKSPTDPETAENYANIFTPASLKVEPWLKADRIEPTYVFEIESSNGDVQAYQLGGSEKLPDLDTIEPTSSLGKAVYHRRVNDEATWRDNETTARIKIKSIRSQYVYAYHRALECASGPLESNAKIKRITISGPKGPIESLRPMLEARKKAQADTLRVIQENNWPVTAAALILGISFTEARELLLRTPDSGIFIGPRSATDHARRRDALSRCKRLILDRSMILTLHELGLLELPNECGISSLVSQQTYEYFLESIQKAKLDLEAEGGTLVLSDSGQISFLKKNKEAAEDLVRRLDEIIGFLDTQCERTGPNRPLSPKEHELADNGLGIHLLSSSVIAEGDPGDTVLGCDDTAAGILLEEQIGVISISTPDLLELALQRSKIPLEKHAQSIFYLIESGFLGIPVPSVVATTYVFSSNRNIETYARVIKALVASALPRAMIVNVCATHLSQIIRQAQLWDGVRAYVISLFEVVAKHLGRPACAQMVKQALSQNIIRTKNIDSLIRDFQMWEKDFIG